MARPATLVRRSRAGISSATPVAVVGGRLFTGLRDVTSDLTALDSRGTWTVVMTFEGAPVCARFERVQRARPWPGRAWVGPDPDGWTSSLDRQAFMDGVSEIRDAISRGEVYQVNLCRVLSAPLPAGSNIAALGARLARGNPAPYSAVVRLPEHGIEVASASPERFLARNGDRVESRPIKGTASRPEQFLEKDRAENVMIVDLVRNDLGRVCETGSVNVDSLCEVEAHPGLHHLVSTVSGRLQSGAGWPELIAATFPPGSVTGAPKGAALEAIGRLEPVPRGPYCGAVGWVDADRREGDLNVAIRTFWAADGCLHFGTGGGITWGSTPEGEWAETELKAHRLLSLASDHAA
ncbi:MAG TPA: chorismate-binding protein [Acidimicrobiales bacterium]|nr:chorismate-binding protein [Acidimicrobiales bacterium]